MIEFNNDTNMDDNNYENQINDSDKNDANSESKRTNKRKQTFERKNIRNIFDDEKFGKDAKEAQKAEFERLKRVQEKEQNIKLHNLLSDDFRITPNHIFQPSNYNNALFADKYVKIFPSLSQQTSVNSTADLSNHYKRNNCASKHYKVVPDDCVIFLDDSDEERERQIPENKVEIIEISDGEDDDDNFDDVVDQEKADIKNVARDENGNILINVAHGPDESDFYLSEKISKFIKPHQVSGIRFLYENLIESKKQFKEADGFGCILAHSMGLGKTIQIIGFLDILFRCCDAKSTLVIVPINTLQNWQAEIENWLPTNEFSSESRQSTEDTNGTESCDTIKPEPTTKKDVLANHRSFHLFVIKDCHKTIESRHAVIKEWMKCGGVLLIGYEMFRLLVTYRQTKTFKPKRKEKETTTAQSKKKIFIDVDLEEKRNNIFQDFLKALVNPGPEIIICDEGHRIKNSEASISKALKAVRTHRRVVMTGYPLQNNLTEYWCMVDFVRPNYLGSKHEFNNMFQRPIDNGQCVDSTVEDRKLMQGRAHVLHELLQGFVQRRSHAVLKANLPPKWEYVILIKMSQIQRKLYSGFMEQLFSGNLYNWSQNSTLKIYAMCCKIWNHPDILFRVLREKMLSYSDPDFDFDIEEEINNSAKLNPSKSKSKPREIKKPLSLSTSGTSPAIQELLEEESNSRLENESNNPDSDNSSFKLFKEMDEQRLPNGPNLAQSSKIPANVMSYSSYLEISKKSTESIDNPYSWIHERSWILDDGNEYALGEKENSGKILVFLSLLEDCLSFGDKMLVFSQSLLTLDVIEYFLKQNKLPDNSLWEKNKTYFRLDGSTSASERERMINLFNEPNSSAHLFLLSTRAGCLGINLIGANRVVVFDASWNPCHDCQAVCRVYRYGQTKPCFIYRLVTDNTMEKKIYDRQITKQGISDRVVDESNPGQHFLRSQVQVLIDYQDQDLSGLSASEIQDIMRGCGEEDPILGRILEKHSEWVTKVPFTHESLLIDRKDYRLTKREKRKAKESYERDKRQSLYYQKNNYSDYYIKTTIPTTDGYVPPRPPVPPYRSSIIPNLSHHSSNLPKFSGNQFTNQYRPNKGLMRPQNMSKPSSALMREIEQARLRCGFPKDRTPFPIAIPDQDDDCIIMRKKSRDNSMTDHNFSRPSQDLISSSSDSSADHNTKKPFNFKPQTDNDSSVETMPDKNFKVIKITATTELNFPSSPSVVTSHAGGTKIPSGEPLEIIYTSKGKFLRVPRTGDLFAIKDNRDRMQHQTVDNYPKLASDNVEMNDSSTGSNQMQSTSDSYSSASAVDQLSSSLSVNGHSSPFTTNVCCPCKYAENLGLNFVDNCNCQCHRDNNIADRINESIVPSTLYHKHSNNKHLQQQQILPKQQQISAQQQILPKMLSKQQILSQQQQMLSQQQQMLSQQQQIFPEMLSKHQMLSQQQQQQNQQLLSQQQQQQFVVNSSLSGTQYNNPYFEHNLMPSLISSPIVVDNNNSHNVEQTTSQINGNLSTNNSLFPSYDFPDM